MRAASTRLTSPDFEWMIVSLDEPLIPFNNSNQSQEHLLRSGDPNSFASLHWGVERTRLEVQRWWFFCFFFFFLILSCSCLQASTLPFPAHVLARSPAMTPRGALLRNTTLLRNPGGNEGFQTQLNDSSPGACLVTLWPNTCVTLS